MLKRQQVESEIRTIVKTEYIEISDQYSVFRSEFIKMSANKSFDVEYTEGIQKTERILKDIENTTKTEPSNMVYVKTPEIERIIRLYGFPNHTERSEFINPETKESENPYKSFMAEVEKINSQNLLTMESIEKDPSILDKLIICDYCELETIELVSGKYVNQAFHTDRFQLYADRVKLLQDVVEDLANDGHLAYKSFRGEKTTFVPGNGTSVFGYINMKEDVFQEIMKAEVESRESDDHRRLEVVFLKTFEKDYFGFSDNYYGKKENDPYLSRYDVEEDEF